MITVNPLLSPPPPPRGTLFQARLREGGRLNREEGAYLRGRGGLFNLFTACLPAALKIKN